MPMKIIQAGFSMSVEGGFWFGLELRSSWSTSQKWFLSPEQIQCIYFSTLLICLTE
jgi:hypothetical protein